MDETSKRPKPAVLIICDGFGVAPASEGNAVSRAKMPNFRDFVRRYPAMTLRASGDEVGLSWGEMGNSEVGHLAIGAGRVYYQMFPRINRDIEAGDFFENPAFLRAVEHVRQNGSRLHLVGMVSGGRVHSMDAHCHALLDFAKRQKLTEVFVHAILDGRDTLYNAGIDFVTTLSQKMAAMKLGKIASLSGRYYAMDRDNRWDRTAKAYHAMVAGEGEIAADPLSAIRESYAKEVYDEEFVPTVILENGRPVATISDNDAIIFFNFRPDRMRQLVKAFVLPEFTTFPRKTLANVYPVTMAEYQGGLPVDVAYPPEKIEKTLAQVLSEAGLAQLHIAETEKYAHVTFFLNGTREEPFPGERRMIVPSPRVASYDLQPEMSADDVTGRVLEAIGKDEYDFIVLNFANADMVGHTGNLDATIKGIETVDKCLGRIVESVLAKDGVVFVTADHGNAEEILNVRTGEMDKEHATSPVPFLVIGKAFDGKPAPSGPVPDGDLSLVAPIGMLADVAPTILSVLGIPQPPDMTGAPLV